MKVNEFFKNVFTYAAGMEHFCKRLYADGGKELNYTFANDFAIADWVSGKKGVDDTYRNVKKNWLNNYKAWTEVVVSLNLLSWANDQLKRQGIEGREPYIALYSQMYEKARNTFYKTYGKDEEACEYFFNMTN